MIWVFTFLTLYGVTASFWTGIALLRLFTEFVFGKHKKGVSGPHVIEHNDVAVMVPAHNEELTIAQTIESLLKLVRPDQIYIGSDASSDRTVEIAQSYSVNVADIQPNRGKAGVLKYLVDNFKLCERYKAILICDADTAIDKNYIINALPLFNDPQVVAIAGHAIPHWKNHLLPRKEMFTIAYRTRLYRVLQAIMRYPQTWKYTNVATIIPGFASMYRTSILHHIDIAAPNLIIEDFNMTFEVHHKKLGKIAYHPSIIGRCHEPTSVRDYTKQVKRWNLGFWQTVRRHGFFFSTFWAALAVFLMEIFFNGTLFLLTPIMVAWFFFVSPHPITIIPPDFIPFVINISLTDVLLGVFVADYMLTVFVALLERKFSMLFYGLGFVLLRFIDAWMYFYTLPMAFFAKSSGKWVSPTRKVIT